MTHITGIYFGYLCKTLWDPIFRSCLQPFFYLYASGLYLSSLTSPPQSPPWPHPNLGRLRPPLPAPGRARSAAYPWPSSQRRLPLAKVAAPPVLAEVAATRPWPSSPPRACAQARRRPHVPELARARTCSISLCPPLAHLAAAELVGACAAPRSRLAALALAGAWSELAASGLVRAWVELG
jgi:hypothetical protein